MGKAKYVICAYCNKPIARHNKDKRVKVEIRSANPKGATVTVHSGGCPKEKR